MGTVVGGSAVIKSSSFSAGPLLAAVYLRLTNRFEMCHARTFSKSLSPTDGVIRREA
jgi:hypothetical protein